MGMVPIRCFSCGKLLADKWDEFKRRVSEGEDPGRVLDDLGLKRYCCRTVMLSTVEFIDDVIRYAMYRRSEEWSNTP